MSNKKEVDIVVEEINLASEEKRDVHIEEIILRLGIELDKKAKLHSDILGELTCTQDAFGNKKYKISINENDHYYRKRFTMAHECGHFLFHRELIGSGVNDNKAYRSTDIGNYHNRLILPQHETEANKFAVSVLMPTTVLQAIARDLQIADLNKPTSEDVKNLAKNLKVSAQALRIRLGAEKGLYHA